MDQVGQAVKTLLDEITDRVVSHSTCTPASKRKLDDVASEGSASSKKSKTDAQCTNVNELESNQSVPDDIPFLMEVEEECVTGESNGDTKNVSRLNLSEYIY